MRTRSLVGLMRCEGTAGVQSQIRSGEVFPLDRGSAGRVILAALGEPGDLYERTRRSGFRITRGERNSKIASVSAAVRGRHGAALGSVSTAGPVERLTASVLARLRARHGLGGEAAWAGAGRHAVDGVAGDLASVRGAGWRVPG